MNLYSEFWKRTFKIVLKGIDPIRAVEFDLTVDELKSIGDRAVSGYNGKLITWNGVVDNYTDSAVFRSLKEHLENFGQLINNVPGQLTLKIYANSILKVSYIPITFDLLIKRYENISEARKKKEIYKWRLVKRFQDGWVQYKEGKKPFIDFFQPVEFRNLIYPVAITVIKHASKDKPVEFEKLLLDLYDEKVDLKLRITSYMKGFEQLYFNLPGHGENTFQEERTIATLLTFRYPDKYTFFKDSFYNKLCKGLGIKPAAKGEKIFHYYKLVEDFLANYLSKKISVIEEKKRGLDETCYADTANLLLAQDILFLTLDSREETEIEEAEIENTLTENIGDSDINKNNKTMYPLNQILFGPPGTGKTYNTINKALEIIGESIERKSREAIKEIFDAKIVEGQIIFTTFHQSMSYEDFIEGIKPIEPRHEGQPLNYKIIDGIFKRACAFAAHNCYKLFIKSKTEAVRYSFDDLYDAFINSIQDQIDKKTPPVYKTLRGRDVEVKEINSNNSIIARAKNSIAKSSAPLTKENLQKLYDKFKTIEEIEDLQQVQETVQITPRITEFYAVFSGLKEFEKSFKPDEQLITESNEVEVLDFEEIQKKFNARVYNEAIKSFGKEAEPVVFIIDEINRGNVSQIFGELITLIEDDKRLGNAEALEVNLPYSKIKFGVPPNLYIIGTMNTADRSVEALDAALRRRFSFEETRPNPGLITPLETLRRFWIKNIGLYGGSNESYDEYESEIRRMLGMQILDTKKYLEYGDRIDSSLSPEEFDTKLANVVSFNGIDLSELLKRINLRVEKLINKDHQIGHSYLMTVSSFDELKSAFQNKIIPLLQEYFFGDYGKIGLVLGKGFFEEIEIARENLFADFDDYDASEFSERTIYKFYDLAKMSEDDFSKAINTLLKK